MNRKKQEPPAARPPGMSHVEPGDAYQGALYRLMPGAERDDRQAEVARSLALEGPLFRPDWTAYSGRLMLSLREAVSLVLGMNPAHQATDTRWQKQYARHVTVPVRLKLREHEELVDLAAADIAGGRLAGAIAPEHQDHRVGVATFAGWAKERHRMELSGEFQSLYTRPSGISVRSPSPLELRKTRILELIASEGQDPKRLPPVAPGKAGVKARVKKLALKDPVQFTQSTFERAWETLMTDGDIRRID